MIKKIVIVAFALVCAFTILFTSILRVAEVKYTLNPIYTDSMVKNSNNPKLDNPDIDYYLAYPGSVLPDHPLWKIKALRDRIWFLLTTNITKKSELYLLFSDKRVQAAYLLFEKGKYESGLTTLSKAEKYLDEASVMEIEARGKGFDTYAIAENMAKAAIMHRFVMEKMLAISPDEAKSEIIKLQYYPDNVYKNKLEHLMARGMECPQNPFFRE